LNMHHHPIGLGVQGLANTFMVLWMPWLKWSWLQLWQVTPCQVLSLAQQLSLENAQGPSYSYTLCSHSPTGKAPNQLAFFPHPD
jgi:hypothetical protein